MGEKLIDFVTLVQGKSVNITSFLTCCLKSRKKCVYLLSSYIISFCYLFFTDLFILLVLKLHVQLN